MINVRLQDLLHQVVSAVERAGLLLVAEWRRDGGPRGTGDKALVDAEIELILKSELLGLLDCDYWGEETEHHISGDRWCWVVDPNDGTSDFLKGIKGSAISVGLLRDNMPVLGVVHAPVTAYGAADTISWADGMSSLIRNGKAIVVDLASSELSPISVVMVSTAAEMKPRTNGDLCSPASFCAMPSIAYRLAKVAAGDGICGVSLYPVSAHDVVAGHALLRGANGVLLNQAGLAITYNPQHGMHVVSDRCFGGAPSACLELASRNWSKVFDVKAD